MNVMPLVRLILAVPVVAVAMLLMVITVPIWFVTALPLLLFFEACWFASAFVGVVHRDAGTRVSEFAGNGMEFAGGVMDATLERTLGWYFDGVVDRLLL